MNASAQSPVMVAPAYDDGNNSWSESVMSAVKSNGGAVAGTVITWSVSVGLFIHPLLKQSAKSSARM